MDGERSPVPWDDIRVFLAAARAGGMSAAARTLAIRQSTVSRRVAALERRLGAAVFDRTAAGLVLTALGRRVLSAAGDAEDALRRVTDAPLAEERAVAGRVRLALTETMASLLVLPRVLPALLARHPMLAVDLVTGDGAADLARREADVAIRFFLTPRGDLLTRRVATLPTAPVARRELARPLLRLPPPRWPWVVAAPAGRAPAEERWLDRWERDPPRLTTSSFHAQYEAVRAGLGVAVLPLALLRLTRGLVALPTPPPPPPEVPVYLVTPRALRRVPRVAAVIEALAAAFAAVETTPASPRRPP